MALLVYFNQVRYSPTEVEYQFGGSEDKLDRFLTFEKNGPEITLNGGKPDAHADAVISRVLARFESDGTWP